MNRSRPSSALAIGLAAAGAAAVAMLLSARRAARAVVMPRLPAAATKYSQVPSQAGKFFTAEKIPKGLLKQHSTKAGTWGVINVSRGRLRYQINEPQVAVFELDAGTPGVIEPEVLHEVAPLSE